MLRFLKHVVVIICCLFIVSASSAQEITSAEYFWDVDPGAGNAVPMIAQDGSFDEALEGIIQNANLPAGTGPKLLGIRVKDLIGNWGPTFRVVVSVESSISSLRDIQVSQGEYYWNTDPGVGNATPMIAQDGNFNESLEGIIQNANLPGVVGPQLLGVRVKDVEGNWGPVFRIVVSIDSSISTIRDIHVSQGEYYWNTDPGVGNATPMIAQDGNFNEALEGIIQNANLPGAVGPQLLGVRVEDVEGNWGPVFRIVVSIDSSISTIRDIQVSQGEYYWNTDPGTGNAIPMIAQDGNFDEALEGIIQNANLPGAVGPQLLGVRVKDIAGNWGPVFRIVVSVDSSISTIRDVKITAAEYFFNNDPGQGNATPMIAQDGNFNEALESILGASIPIPVNAGVNRLSMRVKDAEGAWGPLFSVIVNVDTTIFPCDSLISAFSTSSDYAYAGYTIDLTNDSRNGLSYEWLVNGQSFSTATNTNFTFDSAGVYTLQLVAENTDCYDTATHIIPVGRSKFQKTYGNSDDDKEAVSIVTSDGGYLLAQQNDYSGASSLAVVITKLNVYGGLQWTKTLDSALVDKPTAVLEAGDGSFYIAGYTNTSSSGVDAFVVKLNTNGVVQWQKKFASVAQEYIYGITETSNGDLLLVGGVTGGGLTFGAFDVFATRISSSGNIVWSQVYGGSGNDKASSGYATTDGGFIIAGLTQPGAVLLNYPYFIKINSAGTIEWTLTIPGSSNDDQLFDVIETSGGDFLATGLTYSFGPGSGDLSLFKITSAGAIDWVKGYGNSGSLDAGTGLIETSDGYVVGGYNNIGTFGAEDLMLLKTDFSGNLQWAKSYGGPNEDKAFSLDQALDGGFTLTGHTNSFNTSFEAYLVRTDSLGSSGCQEQNITLNTSGTSPFIGTLSAQNSLPQTVLNSNFTTLSNPIVVAEPCSPSSCNNIYTTLDTTVCFGSTVFGYTATGVYSDTFSLGTGCDSVNILTLTVLSLNNTTVNETICEGGQFAGYNATGQYVDTYTDINGCDSTRTLNLTVNDTVVTIINESICFGSTYQGYSSSGQYVDSYTGSNSCDSTRVLNLTVRSNNSTTLNVSICQGQNYQGYTSTGQYVDTYSDQYGCDSTRTLNLTVNQSIINTIDTSICFGSTYLGYGSTGVYRDTFMTGSCDSVRVLNLFVNTQNSTTVDTTICFGETFASYTASGQYVDVFTDMNGCDSTRTLNLVVRSENTTTIDTSVCFGESYLGYTSSGQFIDTYTDQFGCDSSRTLNLTVLAKDSTYNVVGICSGQSYAGYSSTGVYTDYFTNKFGCDSTVVIDLNVSNFSQRTVNQSICFGSTYLGYSATGVYNDTFTTATCDSIRILNLTVLPENTTSYSESICGGDTLYGYTASGVYVDVFTDMNGCDSTRTLNLSVTPLASTVIDTTVCFGESISGYNSTGIFTDTFATNACDSIRILNLTVLPENTTTLNEVICEGDTLFGYSVSGTYVDAFVAANGCDSSRTLNLTVENGTTDSRSLTICSNDSVLLGGVYVNSAGTYSDTIFVNGGCDTILTVNLLVYPEIVAPNIIQNGNIIQVTSGYAGYQWYQDGILIAGANSSSLAIAVNGEYNVIITDVNGCKISSDTLDITNVSIDDIDLTESVKVYPNPANKVIIVKIEGMNNAELIVYNTLGQALYNNTVYESQPLSIDISLWAAGVYHVKVVNGNKTYTTKVVRAY